MSFNQVTLLGRCGRDAELRTTPQGKSVSSVSVAAGSKDKVTWFSVVAWDKSSEWLAKAKKGDQIFVVGSLQTRPYKNKNNETVTDLVLTATTIRLLAKHDEPAELPSFIDIPDDVPF